MVISLDPLKEPVVLLPLSAFERLVSLEGQASGATSVQSQSFSSFATSHQENRSPALSQQGEIARSIRSSSAVTRDSEERSLVSPATSSPRTPFVSPEDMSSDPVDTWDGEGGEGGEYDAERIFASAAVGRAFSPPHVASQAPDRLKASVSRASEAYGMLGKSGWQAGSGGQRLPMKEQSLQGEERFSLGMG